MVLARPQGSGVYGSGVGRKFPVEEAIHFIRDDYAIVDGAQPAGHDDPHRTGMKKPGGMLGQFLGNLQTFELCAERGSARMSGIVLNRSGSGCLDVIDLVSDTGNDLLQGH